MSKIINTVRLRIILLTILPFNALPALAFDHGAVCDALWNTMYNTSIAPPSGPLCHDGQCEPMNNIMYAEDVVTRDTGPEDPNGEVCGTIHVANGEKMRHCSSHGLGCSGDTCHDGKEWSDCYWNGFTSADKHPLIDGKPYCTGRSGEPAIQCKLHSDGVCTDGGGECTP
jgi:hypothetical protein